MKKLLTLITILFTILTNGQEGIILLSGPQTVQRGQTVTVDITYEALQTCDILLYFQNPAFEEIGFTRVQNIAPGSGTISVDIDIIAGASITELHRYSAFMATVGGWYGDKLGTEFAIPNITVEENTIAADAIYSITGPTEVEPGSTVTVTVAYEAVADTQLILSLQELGTYDGYGFKAEPVSATTGQTSINISITVDALAPIAFENYRWSVFMSPDGAYATGNPEKPQNNISVVENIGSTFTSFASPFSNNMVLQQNSSVKIWGKNEPNLPVSIFTSWDGDAGYIANTDAEGNWSVYIGTPVGSDSPQTVTATGLSSVTLTNVLIGEVWVCSGQSNMEMAIGWQSATMYNKAEGDAFVAAATDDKIRGLSIGRQVNLTPQDSFNVSWRALTGENSRWFSVVGYYYAKALRQQLGVPIGLIYNAYGDSKIQSWMDAETLSPFGITPPTTLPEGDGSKPQHEPTAVFNGAVNPIIGFGIKGIIWYQGESDRSTPIDQYKQMHYALINSWRQKWGYDFSFYPVQIAPYPSGNNKDGAMWNMWRKAYYEIGNTGVVSTIDKKSCNEIHPPEKQYVGDRLAYWALNKDYGYSSVIPSGPLAKTIEIIGNSLKVNFDFAESGLVDQGINGANSGFEIAGADQNYYTANVTINIDNTLTLSSPSVTNPVFARYGFYSDCTVQQATLFNGANLPASAFLLDATLDTTLSIDNKTVNKIRVYPIPADDKLYIDGLNKTSPIMIYNTLGMLVKTANYNNSIDVSNLTKGLYILKQDIISIKFIKN